MPEFPRDEFDEAAAQPGPVGAHRRKGSPAGKILGGILIVILAAGLGYGTTVYLWRAQGNEGLPPIGDQTQPTITQTIGPEVSDSATATPSTSVSATASAAPSETAIPVNLAANVSVLNGAKISGLAGTNADKLKAAGFTAVTASNVSANLPAANTVRYADATMLSTAQKVAEVLGIATVEQGVTPSGDVAVILVTDPSK